MKRALVILFIVIGLASKAQTDSTLNLSNEIYCNYHAMDDTSIMTCICILKNNSTKDTFYYPVRDKYSINGRFIDNTLRRAFRGRYCNEIDITMSFGFIDSLYPIKPGEILTIKYSNKYFFDKHLIKRIFVINDILVINRNGVIEKASSLKLLTENLLFSLRYNSLTNRLITKIIVRKNKILSIENQSDLSRIDFSK